ncbi:MAG: hypothetical protein H7839_13895 [Magnetococcus sp. YQC-5]
MFSIERTVTSSLRWLEQTWERLTEPTLESLRDKLSLLDVPKTSRWSLSAFRLSLSRQGLVLAHWMANMMESPVPPIPQEMPDTLNLYVEPGQWHIQHVPHGSDSWTRPPERLGQWSAPAFRVTLTQSGQLAGGALASLQAEPGELDRFVEQIRLGRRAGFYQAEVFQQARALLRQSASSVSSPD